MRRAAQVPSVCFVAPKNYPLVAGRTDLEHIGGAEVQRTLIARELVRRGFDVSFVTLDHGQPDGVEHDGIRVYKMCGAGDGWPGMRFIYPRWTSLWSALARANADVYYQRTAGVESGQVALWCRLHRRPFVLGIASDSECDPRLPGKAARDRWFFRYALRRADVVVAQTHTQAARLGDWLGLRAAVIRSCTLPPLASSAEYAERLRQPRLLWVGRFATPKRPQWIAELADLCTQWHFDVVGYSNQQERAWAPLLRRLRDLPNVTLHGYVPHDQISRFYNGAAVLICTSVWEGYPNTFVEAWSHGVPVVSTVDPDGVIRQHGLGRVGSTPDQLADAIAELLASPESWRECAERAVRFFAQRHTVAAVGEAYEELFRTLAAGGRLARKSGAPAPARVLSADHQ